MDNFADKIKRKIRIKIFLEVIVAIVGLYFLLDGLTKIGENENGKFPIRWLIIAVLCIIAIVILAKTRKKDYENWKKADEYIHGTGEQENDEDQKRLEALHQKEQYSLNGNKIPTSSTDQNGNKNGEAGENAGEEKKEEHQIGTFNKDFKLKSQQASSTDFSNRSVLDRFK